jgi:hypothetical protein
MLKWLLGLFKKKQVEQVSGPVIYIPHPPATGRELPDPEERGSFKLGVVVGHNSASQGAQLNHPTKLSEYAYNTDIAKLMKEMAPVGMQVEIIYRKPGKGYTEEIREAYQEAKDKLCDCVIELHFNGFDGSVRGTSTLCSPDVSDVNFAHVVQNAMVALFKREGKQNRGVKTISKSARGGGAVHSFQGGVNCLVEPFFGDNKEEALMAISMKSHYAKCLVDAVALWAKKVDLIKA